jgi:hypothetical protein
MPVSSVGAALNPIRTQGRCRGQSDPARRARERVLQPPVAPFHHTIRLGVEGGGWLVLDAQMLAQGVPDGQGELCAPVRGQLRPHSVSGDPTGDESVCAGGGGDVTHGQCL